MIAYFSELGSVIVVFCLNVLLQVTVVTSIALVLVNLLRPSPVIRSAILSTASMLALISPVLTCVLQTSGRTVFVVQLFDEVSTPPVADTDIRSAGIAAIPGEGYRTSRLESQSAAASGRPAPDQAHPRSLPTMTPVTVDIERTASASAPTPSWRPWWNILVGCIVCWWLVAALLLLRMLFNLSRLRAILQAARPVSDRAAIAVLRRTLELLPGLRQRFAATDLLSSDCVWGPFTAGIWRPKIVLPESLINSLNAEQLGEVLLHELAHVERRDPLIVLVQSVVGAIYWLQPLVHLVNRQLAQTREEVCDNFVLAARSGSDYGRTLVAVTQWSQSRKALAGTVGMFASRYRLEHRVSGLLNPRRHRNTRLSAWGRVSVACATLVLTLAGGILSLQVAANEPSALDNRDGEQESGTAESGAKNERHLRGTITDAHGKPVSNAVVSAIADQVTNDRGHVTETLDDGVTDKAGQFELRLPDTSARTHANPLLVARADDLALGWRGFDLEAAEQQIDIELNTSQAITLQLVDDQDAPAAGVTVAISAVWPRGKNGEWPTPELALRLFSVSCQAVPNLTSGTDGRLTVPHINADCAVTLTVAASDRFAAQPILLNSGQPDERPRRDATYRGIVRNIGPDEIAKIELAPARTFSGTVLLGYTGKRATDSRITIWSSERPYGSMLSTFGKTDKEGQFRLSPFAGIRFGIEAYPPADAAFLPIRSAELARDAERSRSLELRLPPGILVSGRVIDAQSGQPLAGAAILYEPQRDNRLVPENTITGWQDIHLTDNAGEFHFAVPPGPGSLLVHSPAGKDFALGQTSDGEIYDGKPWGRRNYVHALLKIDPPMPDKNTPGRAKLLDALTIELRPAQPVTANVVDEEGRPVEDAIYTHRLLVTALSPAYSGLTQKTYRGRVEIQGLAPGEHCDVIILQPDRRLGAVSRLSTDTPRPTIVLRPCGSATATAVDSRGKPVSEGLWLSLVVTPGDADLDGREQPGGLSPDETFVGNFDDTNYPRFGFPVRDGKFNFPALIPGATYRLISDLHASDLHAGKARQFVADSGKHIDLGNVAVE